MEFDVTAMDAKDHVGPSNKDKIHTLSTTDAGISAAFNMRYATGISYTEMLEEIVLNLHERSNSFEDRLMEYIKNNPQPLLMKGPNNG